MNAQPGERFHENLPANIGADTLPTLIDRATAALDNARSSAEVLEARDLSRVAYDAAKSAGRMARAKQAHDDVIGAVYRAQADALLIEARAKVRLADEYDAAQERGEVAKAGGDRKINVADGNVEITTAADLGIRRDEIHDARRLRDAERADPGLAARALQQMVDARKEPTRAELQRSVLAAVQDTARRPSNRNPHHVPDAKRDRVIGFTGDCSRIADAPDLEALAAFNGHPAFRGQMIQKARAAHGALTQFLRMVESE